MTRRPHFRGSRVRVAGAFGLAVVGLLVAGCNGGDDAGTDSASDAPSPEAAPRDAPEAALRTPSAEEVPEAFRSAVFEADGPVLVYFHAPWHAESQELRPVIEEIQASRPDLRALFVNVDEDQQVAQAYRVPGVPVAAILRQGAPEAVLADGLTPEALKSWVDDQI